MAQHLVTNLRHEIKLLIPYADYIALSGKLSAVLDKDEYTKSDGDYFIRSLYLDDIYDSSYVEKLGGSDNRKKYRIRIYNLADNVIKLECKEKHGSRIKKTSCSITREIYESYMNGDFDALLTIDHPLAKEVYTLARSKCLSPSVIVDYDREAYVHPLSNTRLTFDKFLRAGINGFEIFDDSITTMPVFNNDLIIFEVKYDDFIPSYLCDMFNSIRGDKIALSKFCMCRDKLSSLNLAGIKKSKTIGISK